MDKMSNKSKTQTKMEYVTKRDGKKEEVDFSKVYKRIERMTFRLAKDQLNVHQVSKSVISGIYNGVTTAELDQLTVKVAGAMTVEHPDYGTLAGRISISSMKKGCPSKFSDAIGKLYVYEHPKVGGHAPVVSRELYDVVMADADFWDSVIVEERDWDYNIFAVETLKKSYFLKCGTDVVETPQFMHLRVALGINIKDGQVDKEGVVETYNAISTFRYTHASPTIFNSGTPHPQLASCFLIKNKGDSIDGIYGSLLECAKISKHAGGIGLSFHDVRSKGAYIKGNNGTADGIVPALRNFNETARYVNQGGRRKGAIAIYLEPHHADIFDFLDLRKGHGAEERRCRDLFTALWISDLFMQRCKDNGDWTLFDPSTAPGLNEVHGEEYARLYEQYEFEGRGVKTVKAQDVWNAICVSLIETGTPYMLNKDACNALSNQRNLGTIQSSNLCVAPETPILTSKGYIPIADLKDQEVDVWNGQEWSTTTVKQTGVDQKLIKVVLSNGSEVECTPYHKFYVETGSRPADKSVPIAVDAKDLTVGQKLIKHDLPEIDTSGFPDFPYAYTHGFYCGDGTDGYCNGKRQPRITLYGQKKSLMQEIDYQSSSLKETASGTINLHLHVDIPCKFTVPHGFSHKSKLEWFAGLCDSDGTVVVHGDKDSIQIWSIHKDFLISVMLLLQTMGINSKVTPGRPARQEMLPDGEGGKKLFNCSPTVRLLVSSGNTLKLLSMGLPVKRLVFQHNVPQRDASRFTTVKAVIDEDRVDDTYCFTESKRGMGMFGGVLIGQCAEIVEYTSEEETSVCQLASINLSHFVGDDGSYDYDALADTASLAVKNLNKIIDIGFYPVETARRSMMAHRPIGLGVNGLADVYFKMGIPWDSPSAEQLNRNMHEALYYGAVRQTVAEAEVSGKYDSYKGSPASQGKLQFDLWRDKFAADPALLGRLTKSTLGWATKWDDLRVAQGKHGMRNSLLTALMPTASSATILGVYECFECQTSNIYRRSVLSGEFAVVNKYLVNDLIKLDMWTPEVRNSIIANDGSVQHLEQIPKEIRSVYKTVWELSMKAVIDQSFDRSQYVDQSQSLNMFLKNPNIRKITSMLFYSWTRGLKTMSYYLRSRSSSEAQKFTVEDAACTSCSA